MRKYTLVFSIVAHAGVVGAIVFASIIATGAVPRPLERIRVVLAQPELPPAPPVRPRTSQPQATPSPAAVPLIEPEILAPESPPAPSAPTIDEIPTVIGGIPGDGTETDGLIGGRAPEPPPLPRPVVPVRVGGRVLPPERVHYVTPVYPPLAIAARKTGLVILEAVVGEDGTVRDLRVLKSEPLLDAAAIAAVRQWRYRPTTLNGQTTPVLMTVTVQFTLN